MCLYFKLKTVDINIIITVIIIQQFVLKDIKLYVQEKRLHNPCGFVSDSKLCM